MARIASPWFWEERNGWYVNKNGQRHRLGDHPAEQPPPRKIKGKWAAPPAITQAFHALMAAPAAAPRLQNVPNGLTVAEVFDKFLTWTGKHRAARTAEWYHDHLQDFIDRFPKVAALPAADIRPFHVVEWADAHGDEWSNAYRRGGIIAVQRPFNWAVELGHLTDSPIKKVPKPTPQRREQVVSPDEWVAIRDRYADGDPFRDILEFCWESGCRPHEAKTIEARHVELAARRVVFPPAEAKGKKRYRVIHLTARAEEVVRRRLRPSGVLFCNEDGVPWTAQAMSCRFGRLKKRLGVKYACYSVRHGFCQRLLEDGTDHLTVAALMGHANGRMVSETYSHMNQADGHLRDALTKASSGSVE